MHENSRRIGFFLLQSSNLFSFKQADKCQLQVRAPEKKEVGVLWDISQPLKKKTAVTARPIALILNLNGHWLGLEETAQPRWTCDYSNPPSLPSSSSSGWADVGLITFVSTLVLSVYGQISCPLLKYVLSFINRLQCTQFFQVGQQYLGVGSPSSYIC